MKKRLLLSMILVIVLSTAMPAYAASPVESEQEFFTWAMLATYAGALLATVLITQLLKNVSVFKASSAASSEMM